MRPARPTTRPSTRRLTRRRILSAGSAAALALPFFDLLTPGRSRAASGVAERLLVVYFPDGVVGPSQNGEPTQWHASGSESSPTLSPQLEPLGELADECVFLNGLSMGPTDSGSHPGGAKKLLTGVDGGNGESIDQYLARTAGADAPFRHLLLGAMANQNNASGDKHISYVGPGQTLPPQDDPAAAFDSLFGHLRPGGARPAGPDPIALSIIDAAKDDLSRLRSKLGDVEAAKLDYHLESLREVEQRIEGLGSLPTCDSPSIDAPTELYDDSQFPALLDAQMDLMVLAMACGLTRVGVLQCSHHTSDLLMSQFPGSAMYDPGFDMRSHQASHYGPAHDPSKIEYSSYLEQRRWWVERYASILQRLADTPDPVGGSMLDNSVVLLCTEVCDGNTHLHDDMPFIVGGRAGGSIDPGRLLSYAGDRHAGLLCSLAHAMGETIDGWGDTHSAPLPGLVV